ncbi:hypothetical protein Q3G72_035377 [Acer saccharum]|nr:hypothetical protein Q3G72_035377 [Acer saccharum]
MRRTKAQWSQFDHLHNCNSITKNGGFKSISINSLAVSLDLVLFTLVTSTSAPVPNPPPPPNCPKLDVCLNVLDLLCLISIGGRPPSSCCTIIQGLADLDADVCLCTALQVQLPGINLNVTVTLNLLVNRCTGNNVFL